MDVLWGCRPPKLKYKTKSKKIKITKTNGNLMCGNGMRMSDVVHLMKQACRLKLHRCTLPVGPTRRTSRQRDREAGRDRDGHHSIWPCREGRHDRGLTYIPWAYLNTIHPPCSCSLHRLMRSDTVYKGQDKVVVVGCWLTPQPKGYWVRWPRPTWRHG